MTQLPFGGKAPKPLPWHPLPMMEDYLENLEIEERTPSYVNSVKLGLAHFGMFAQQEGIKHPAEIERLHVLRFQGYLNAVTKENGEPLKLGTKQLQMRHLRTWIRWLLDTEVLVHDPWIRIRIGRIAKKPNPLEDDEIAQLFAAHMQQAFSISPFFYHRRETILTLLYGWGLRVHELQGLTVSGMDMRLDWVTAKNKGGGTKVLPYADEMKQITQRWLVQRAKKAVPEIDALLIDQHGNELTTHHLRKIFSELGIGQGSTSIPTDSETLSAPR